ncbi:uncharacterized protein [Rutidosis leptorrhynchoides]|uniref:uncharacterized protein n=1 Tax=Rutidosis leptorrhynchoides TaxID=125765 RepID=UPI003A998DC5
MATPGKYDKIYTVTSVTHLIPIKLDLNKHNYVHWSQLFSNHCAAFNVDSFLSASSTSDPPPDEWKKADAVVMGWIYITISESFLERLLNSQPTTAHVAWEFLKNLFLENKRSKVVELMAELHSLTIGDLTADAYFRKIDSIASMLDNLGSKIKDEELVTYAITGLNDRYPHATHIILHSKDFSDLNIRSMITLEEMQSQRKNRGLHESQGTPSTPTALVAQANHQPPSRSSNTTTQVCRNFSRGHCRFGERCRYIHQTTRPGNLQSQNHTSRSTGSSQAPLLSIIASQQNLLAQQHFNRSASHSTASFGPRTPLAQTTGPPGFHVGPQANCIGLSTVGPNHLPSSSIYGQQAPFTGPTVHGLSTITPGSTATGPAQASLGPIAFTAQPSPYTFNFAAQPGQATIVPNAFSTTALPDYGNSGWTMDTGASTHLTSSINSLTTIFNHCMYPSVAVGDGNLIPVTNTGHSVLPNPNRPLHLSNVLVTPNIVKNLISVRKFTRDNKVSVSFDEFGFSVKDYLTRRLLLRCDSTGDLYPLTAQPSTTTPQTLLATPSIWHQRLGHPSTDVFHRLVSNNYIACNNTKSATLCHACQLGKHTRLPFNNSVSNVSSLFDIVHSDLWISPIPSLSGYKYYVLFLDHYSHYLRVFPLRNKSELFDKFVQFRTYIKTQFKYEIKAFQCDNGGEFNNKQIHQLFQSNGIHIRFSCPHTSQQNGKSERMIRTIINLIRTLLFQANLPPTFWVEALHMTTYLLNLLPSSSINHEIPHTHLYKYKPNYFTLRVFECLCYPHLHTTHKLQPRSTPCIFLGYPSNHRGYRCYDLSTHQIILSRHVTFDGTSFPHGVTNNTPPPSYEFLDPAPPNLFSRDLSDPLPTTITEPSTSNTPRTPPTPPTPPTSPVQPVNPNPAPSPPPPAQHNTSTHPMVTRHHVGTTKPVDRLNLIVSTPSPTPKTYSHAFNDPNWQHAMTDEYNALIKNDIRLAW